MAEEDELVIDDDVFVFDDDEDVDPVLAAFYEAIEDGRVDDVARLLREHEIDINDDQGNDLGHPRCGWRAGTATTTSRDC